MHRAGQYPLNFKRSEPAAAGVTDAEAETGLFRSRRRSLYSGRCGGENASGTFARRHAYATQGCKSHESCQRDRHHLRFRPAGPRLVHRVEGFRPFRQIADSLARRGIAVLRMDDRGTGASGGTFKGSTSADFAEDVRAGLAYLRTRPRSGPTALGCSATAKAL